MSLSSLLAAVKQIVLAPVATAVRLLAGDSMARDYVEPRTLTLAPSGMAESIPEIPRIIWTYWHSERPPKVVDLCMRNWVRHNPDYTLNALHAGNIDRYIEAGELPEGFAQLPEYRKADWLRIALVRRYGGFWLDASMFLNQSLEWMREAQQRAKASYVGFYLETYTTSRMHPVIENWCFAAPAGSPFVEAWYRELTDEVIAKGESTYLDRLEAVGVRDDAVRGIPNAQYLIMHVAAQRVLRQSSEHRIHVFRAEDTAYLYHERLAWKRAHVSLALLLLQRPRLAAPLVKLRGSERRKIERFIRAGLWRRGSLAGSELLDTSAVPAPAGTAP